VLTILDLPKNRSFNRYGYVIAVTSIDNIGVGKIQPGKSKTSIEG
jgi:DNA-directed RNA polymerase subunit E'/Rpb7